MTEPAAADQRQLHVKASSKLLSLQELYLTFPPPSAYYTEAGKLLAWLLAAWPLLGSCLLLAV